MSKPRRILSIDIFRGIHIIYGKSKYETPVSISLLLIDSFNSSIEL